MTAPPAEPARQSLLERRSFFIFVLALLLGTTLVAEFRSYARPDTGFLLEAAGRVLDGGRLYVDVVEINPPLIVALNALAVLFARTLGLPEILVYRLGFTAIVLGALWLSARLLRRLLPGHDGLRHVLVLFLAFVLFPLAGPDYGEREHLVLALLVPYLLLTTARNLGHEVTRVEGIVLGLVAGLAFALKPHFLVLWFLVEAFLRGTGRVAPRALLPETLSIAVFLVAYGALIAALTPEYFEVVRLLAGSYSRFLYDPFLHLLVTGPGAVLAIFALLTFAALWRHARHPELWRSIALATVACLIAGAAQQKGLRYHFYPAFALATVMLGLIVFDCTHPVGSRVRLVYRSLAVGVLAAIVAVVCLGQATAAAGWVRDPGRDHFEEMVGLVRARAEGAGVFVMSYHIRSAYPLITYSDVRSASRFPHLWILAAEYLDELKSDRPLRYREEREMSASERYLNRSVLEDLRQRPKLLIVLQHARDLSVNGYRRLDYVAYFSRDPRITQVFQEYQLIAEMGDYMVYEWVPVGARRTGARPTVIPGTHDIVLTKEGGAQLRFGDSSFAVAVLTFLFSLTAVGLSERGRRKPISEDTAMRRLPEGASSE